MKLKPGMLISKYDNKIIFLILGSFYRKSNMRWKKYIDKNRKSPELINLYCLKYSHKKHCVGKTYMWSYEGTCANVNSGMWYIVSKGKKISYM